MLTESDVEQKFILGLLTRSSPDGLGYFLDDIHTKRDIRKIVIGKGSTSKLYYPDYAIVLDGLPALIVEAKEPNDSDLDEAYREARLYASELNSLYKSKINPCSKVIATNGKRLLAGFSDSQHPIIDLDLKYSLPTNSQYIDLLGFASRDTLCSFVSGIRAQIKGVSRYIKPIYMLGGQSVINETVGENDFGANVSLEYQSLFNPETIEEKSGIAENAYISSKRRESHVAPIDRVLRATIPPHQRAARVIGDTENPREIIEVLGNFENRDRLKNEMFLLVGGVGSGKSTFTEFLRVKALPRSIVASTRWININLNNAPLSKDKIYDWLVKQITLKIRGLFRETDFDELDFLQKLYSEELTAIRKGRASLFAPNSLQHLEIIASELEKLQGDSVKTLINLVELLFEKNELLLVIVLDNCDKRSRDDQLLMFEVAAWMKSTFRCLIFLPIRDTTYDLYSSLPPLDTVIKDLVFRIEPPLLEKVLQARMDYLLRSIDGNLNDFKYSTRNGLIVNCPRSEVANFMRCIIATLFQDQHFKAIIKGIGGRNIRRGLEVVLDFCKSGHISNDAITRMRLTNGDSRLPSHLAYKVLLKGNRRYFSDEKSRLLNLFHSSGHDDLPDPFVRLDILIWLKSKFSVKGPNNANGYHKAESLIQSMQGIGHARDRVIQEIQALVEAELIMPEGLAENVGLDDLLIITAAGFTHLEIVRNVSYLSTVSEDSLFRDASKAKEIADNLVGRAAFAIDSKEAALANATTFVNYLSEYNKEYFLPNLSSSDETSIDHRKVLSDLKLYLASKDTKSEELLLASRIEHEFPAQSEHYGQVVSVQNYGIFVELAPGISCLVHSSKLGRPATEVLTEIDEGDDVIVRIIEFNKKNGRLNGSLVSY